MTAKQDYAPPGDNPRGKADMRPSHTTSTSRGQRSSSQASSPRNVPKAPAITPKKSITTRSSSTSQLHKNTKNSY